MLTVEPGRGAILFVSALHRRFGVMIEEPDTDPDTQLGPDSDHREPAVPESTGSDPDLSDVGKAGAPGAFAVADSIRPLFEQAMDQTRMAMVLSDPTRPDAPLVYVNQAFVELTGYPREEILGRNCRFLQGADTEPETVARIAQAIRRESVVVEELLNYRADGTPFWNALHVGPIYDVDGRLRYYFGSQWDVSELRQAREAQFQARTLATELTSRLRQLFPIISNVVKMTARHEGEPRFARHINDRIAALSRAYEATLNEGAPRQASLAPVARAVLEPYRLPSPAGGAERVRISGEGVAMAAEVVSLLGLVLHELVTRAADGGSLSVPDGTVELSWAFDAHRAFVLEWREHGRGQGRPSFEGPPMLDDLVASAGGKLVSRQRPDGYQARLSLPRAAWSRENERHR